MAEIIVIASGKGVVGKSTFSSFLGRQLSAEGFRVLLIDSDTGLGALDIMLGVTEQKLNSWLDASEEYCTTEAAIITVSEKLALLPSPEIYPDKIDDDVFVKIIAQCEENYDYIIIDASAGIDENLRRAVKCADRIIFVATADEVSVRCAAAAANQAEALGIDRSDMRLIINRFIKRRQ